MKQIIKIPTTRDLQLNVQKQKQGSEILRAYIQLKMKFIYLLQD